MNYRDFRAAVNAANLHDLADTSALGVEITAHGLQIDFDTEHWTSEIDELKDDVKRYEESEKTLEARIAELEKERDEMEDVLRQVRHEGAKKTLADYMKKAADAEEEAERHAQLVRDYRQAMDAAQAECKALRRKKGVEAGTVRHANAIRSLLSEIMRCPIERLPECREDCRKMLEKINAS